MSNDLFLEELTDLNIFEPANDEFFITSDTWFGRPQIIDIANRFGLASSVDEMNHNLVKNWNNVVGKDDVVFHLGNFAWDPLTAKNILSRLNGKINFLLGNADSALLEVAGDFENVNIMDDSIIELSNYNSVLCHYPLEVWAGQSTGIIHFHGHTVFSHKTDLSVSNRINVCIDNWNYTPLRFSTIKEFINAKKK
jgi:calcineurin-like phosphoesterase family protein